MADNAPILIAGTHIHVNGATGTSQSFAYDSGVGTDRCLIVSVGTEIGKNGVSAITYNGVALTLLHTYTHPNPAGTFMEEMRVYYMLDPPTGSNTFSITFNNSSFDYSVQLSTLENVNQDTPFGTPVDALYEEPDTTAEVDITTTGTNSAIFVAGVINGAGCAPFTAIANTSILTQGAQAVAANLGFAYYTGFRGSLATTGTYTVGATSDSAVDGAPSDTLVTGFEIFGTDDSGGGELNLALTAELDDPEVSASVVTEHNLSITASLDDPEVSANLTVQQQLALTAIFDDLQVALSMEGITQRNLSIDGIFDEIEMISNIESQHNISISIEFEDYTANLRIRDEIPEPSQNKTRRMGLISLSIGL